MVIRLVKIEQYEVAFTTSELKEMGKWERYAEDLRSVHQNPDDYSEEHIHEFDLDYEFER